MPFKVYSRKVGIGLKWRKELNMRIEPSQEQILVEHLNGLGFCDFDKPCKRACQKEKIKSIKQSKEEGTSK